MTDLVKYPFTKNNESVIADILSENKVLAFPTETVYGWAETRFQKKLQIEYT